MKHISNYSFTKTIYEIDYNLSNSLEKFISNDSSYKKALLVTDNNIYKLYKEKIFNYKNLFNDFNYVVLTAGEKAKSKKTIEKIYKELLKYSFNRSDYLISLGGGVIGDICGFISSTYMRGINFISIPTTLLAQVDASIGGKTGYNYSGKKNIIGTFYHPTYLIIDPLFIKTLNEKELKNGLSEIIKYALIGDKKLYKFLSDSTLYDFRTNDKFVLDIIKRCIKTKIKFVTKDPFDNNVRMKLNFGHTLGHIIEALGNFKEHSHGEAVSIGMCMITKLSDKKYGTYLYPKVKSILKKYKLPTSCKYKKRDIKSLLKFDKKNNAKSINIIILKNIGKAIIKEESINFF